MKLLLPVLIACIFYFSANKCFCQCRESKIICDEINTIDTNKALTNPQKITELYIIKENAERCKLINDTAYVFALIKIGSYERIVNEDYSKAINYTAKALEINKALKSKASQRLNIMAYYNLGFFYNRQLIYKQALLYYDSVITFCKYSNGYDSCEMNALSERTNIYFKTGDYEKAVEESSIGMNFSLQQKDTAHFVYFLNRKAQSLFFENNLTEALDDAKAAIPLAKNIGFFELATAYKILGLIYEKKNQLDSALYFYTLGLKTRKLSKNVSVIASDYNDLGNFYLNSFKQYKIAGENYNHALLYASKMDDSLSRSLKQALIYTNLGENSLKQNKLEEATKFFLLDFYYLNINLHNNILNTPALEQLSDVVNKDLVIVLLSDETQLLLEQFKKTKQKIYLDACINTAVLTDSVITKIRHEQLGEKSKLYWRNKTRDFFSTAMEACYAANNSSLAFYFLEKSRSVLLNDKLNELGASALLSETEILKQEDMQIKISRLQQKLSALHDMSKKYQAIQLQLLNSKKEYEHLIASLEKNHPAYYQYKYADKVPSLKELQQYLAKNNQSFVNYFLGDTVTYILAITPTKTKFIRLSQREFHKDKLADFLQLCASKEALNSQYDSFAQLSNSIYKAIFQPLQLPKGRTIICADNIAIPFEALCTDNKGNNFLLNDYSFSYVYSARFLMKQFNNPVAKGNFAGFAPVSFDPSLKVPELKNAGNALHASAAYYKNNKLFTHQSASRQNFFYYAPAYSIVSIFSHAFADTANNEPVLFMQDSVIHLSELQLLNDPATKLVLLSACQTNVGKAATGEGIYSLARGFATAGIPSIAATLWKADEETIYSISEKFNEYLSEGMTKDEALQKAKLYFMQHNNSEKTLPYYWANMILIGNTDPISLTTSNNNYRWWIIGICVLITLLIFLVIKSKTGKRKS